VNCGCIAIQIPLTHQIAVVHDADAVAMPDESRDDFDAVRGLHSRQGLWRHRGRFIAAFECGLLLRAPSVSGKRCCAARIAEGYAIHRSAISAAHHGARSIRGSSCLRCCEAREESIVERSIIGHLGYVIKKMAEDINGSSREPCCSGFVVASWGLIPQTPRGYPKSRGYRRQGQGSCRPIAGVSEDAFDERKGLARQLQHVTHAVAILDVGGMDDNAQQEAERIDKDVPFAARELLARIIGLWADCGAPFERPWRSGCRNHSLFRDSLC
jgi:hypothetical protein